MDHALQHELVSSSHHLNAREFYEQFLNVTLSLRQLQLRPAHEPHVVALLVEHEARMALPDPR